LVQICGKLSLITVKCAVNNALTHLEIFTRVDKAGTQHLVSLVLVVREQLVVSQLIVLLLLVIIHIFQKDNVVQSVHKTLVNVLMVE